MLPIEDLLNITRYTALEANLPDSEQQKSTLGQSISGATDSTPWYMSVRFNSSGYAGDGCYVEFGTDLERIMTRYYSYDDPMPSTGDIYASGAFYGSPTWFYMSFICESGGSSPIERRQAAEVWASFDDLSLTYAPSVPDPEAPSSMSASPEVPSPTSTPDPGLTETTTPTPTDSARRQVVTNNDFASGSLTPWTTTKYDDYSDPAVVEGGIAIARIPRVVTTNWAQGSFDQTLYAMSSSDVGKLATVQADIYVTIADAGSKCFVRIDSVDDNFWSSGDILSSQTFHVDRQITLQYASASVSIFWGCYGTGTTTSVAIDNVYYYIDELGSVVSPSSSSSDSFTSTARSTSSATSSTPSASPIEALTNNDFSSGLAPWTTSGPTGRSTFAIVDGAARVTFNNIDPDNDSSSIYKQIMTQPSQVGQRVRVQADVYFYVPNAGTYCWGNIYLGNPANWYLSMTTSQAAHVDETIVLTYGTSEFTFETSCVGTGASTYVSVDNVYVTLNAP
jgi:hypothetical protein